MYSFIVPRKKITIDTLTYVWLLFILFTTIILTAIGFYIDGKNSKFDLYKNEIKNKIEKNINKRKNIDKDIKYLLYIYKEYKKASLSNKSLKDAIKNLISFIPNQIIINRLVLNKYEVKIYGYIDSPKTYKLLLGPLLKSIFDKTRVGFTKIENGKYLFSSYNKIKRVNNEKK